MNYYNWNVDLSDNNWGNNFGSQKAIAMNTEIFRDTYSFIQ